MIELRSLDLKVQGSAAGGYTVEAMGPEGERASAAFGGASVMGLVPELGELQVGGANRAGLEGVGTALFQALFPMQVMMVYVAVRAQAGDDEGLRLRLHLPPELARLPWELLYYPPYYLALDPRSPVVRFLDLPDTPRPLATHPPLRLLHFVAEPTDAPELKVEQEVGQLRSALADMEQEVEVVPARPGTVAALLDGLREGCQVLHFSGHGGFSGEEGYLLLEDQQGLSQPTDGETLAQMLRGSSVRLALLNACESATTGDSDAFGSVAAALVRAGLPAVIAHQCPMPDGSAISFAVEFYRALADGYPVDTAVCEGRKAVLAALGPAWRDRVDWAIPVLFMRAPDGRILALEREEGTRAAPAATGPMVQIDSISGGTFTFDQRVMAGGVEEARRAQAPGAGQAQAPSADPLPRLLEELGRAVQDYAPEAKWAGAMEQVAALEEAAAQERPDLEVLDSVWRWFQAEVPSLAGAALSAILGFESRVAAAGDELLREFRRRYKEGW